MLFVANLDNFVANRVANRVANFVGLKPLLMASLTKTTVTLWQDKRRKKKDGTFPVKMQVFNSTKRKHYSTGISLSKNDFEKAWNGKKPRGKLKEVREQLEEITDKAEDVISRLDEFTFPAFESELFGTTGAEGHDLFSLYNEKIDRFRKLDRPGTADWYKHSRDSIIKFLNHVKTKVPERLEFEDVTVKFLEDYEYFMIKVSEKSRTTVGMYARALRSIFNTAKESGYTNHYPFGKRLYQPPDPKKVKKALSDKELDKLVNAEPKVPEQERAKDWFLLSYCFAGANFRDLMEIRNKDLEGDYLTFYRKKTERTSERPVTVPITKQAREIIEKYRGKNLDPDSPAFDFVSSKATAKEKQRIAKNSIKFINQHLKPLAKKIGINEAISYQWARHTFNTLAVQSGASLEWVQQMQGHANIKTTLNYFQGFPQDKTKSIMERLTNF